MADVHFVVGPPGGTQRLPGHKVSNSCITGLVLRFMSRDPHSPEPGVGSLPMAGSAHFTGLQRKQILSKGFLATLNFVFVSFYVVIYINHTEHALFTLQ